jgi:alpha-glucosidase
VFSGSAWTWNEARQQYYLHQFTAEQPDLNFREPRVVQAMKDVLTFWLDQGVDGFRVDDINFLFEDPAMRNEPESGLEVENDDYSFLNHIYTVDAVS